MYNLPFKPYPGQIEFIKNAISVLDNNEIGLFESPTGSGKTICILYSSLTWLKNFRLKANSNNVSSTGSESKLPSWVKQKINKLNELNNKRTFSDRLNNISNIKATVDKYIGFDDQCNVIIKLKKSLDLSHSDFHIKKMHKKNSNPIDIHITPAFDEFDEVDKCQIIICSRTHTQLGQFIKEVKKLDPAIYNDIRFAIASSRQYLCVNQQIIESTISSSDLLNDECRKSSCYYKTNTTPIIESSIAYPLDHNDLRLIGSDNCLSSCPYYASKHTIRYADVVLAPYNFIINKSLRKSSGLRINNNILIFDEAHNIGDAISNSTSSSFTSFDALILNDQIQMYIKKYNSLLHKESIDNLNSIIKFLESFTSIKITEEEKVIDISQFIVESGSATLSIHSILDYLTNSEICRKLRGFIEALYNKLDYNYGKEPIIIYMLREFISCILLCTGDDKVIVTPITESCYSKDILNKLSCDCCVKIEIYSLSIFDSFSDIITSAKSVMLVSGTLTPIYEYLLMIPEKKDSVRIFRNPGIFSIERMYCNIISTIPSNNNSINFTFESRTDANIINGLCEIIKYLSLVVPEGLLIFFTSFSYMNLFLCHALGNKYKINQFNGPLSNINKKIFIEGTSTNIMDEYSKSAIDGAVLFAIFGAKFSEGIDFSNHLARAIILVGLPYPPESCKLKLKQEYYQNKQTQSVACETSSLPINLSSQVNIFNLKEIKASLKAEIINLRKIICFKKINQTIGRAIRHVNDYAAILFIDSRYKHDANKKYLSQNVINSLENQKGSIACLDKHLFSIKNKVNDDNVGNEFIKLLAELENFYCQMKLKN